MASQNFTDSVISTEEVPDLSPCEFALSMDHISAKIFNALSPKDLFNCRLVSYNWMLLSTNFLRNQIKVNAFGGNLNINFSSSLPKKPKLEFSRSSIQELFTLLKQADHPEIFPCGKFHFRFPLFDKHFEKFLSVYGMIMEELSFTIHLDPQKPLQRVLVSEEIKNILTQKTPNITSFYFAVSTGEYLENNNIFPEWLPLLPENPEFHSIQKSIQSQMLFNTKLKFLEVAIDTKATLLEAVIQLSPNLEEVISDPKNCEIYISPLNRLHLLKRLKFNPFGRLDQLENLASFAIVEEKEGIGSKLLLQEISIDFTESIQTSMNISAPVIDQRILSVLYDILECSKSTLEVISWNGMTFVNGIQFPIVMPKVWKMELISLTSTDFGIFFTKYHLNKMICSFQEGFTFAQAFPNLRYIQVNCTKGFATLRRFLVYLKLDIMPSVEKIGIDCGDDRLLMPISMPRKGTMLIPEKYLELIQRIFPNATLLNLKHF